MTENEGFKCNIITHKKMRGKTCQKNFKNLAVHSTGLLQILKGLLKDFQYGQKHGCGNLAGIFFRDFSRLSRQNFQRFNDIFTRQF